MDMRLQKLLICLAIFIAIICRYLNIFILTPYVIVDIILAFQLIVCSWLIINICIECLKEKIKNVQNRKNGHPYDKM